MANKENTFYTHNDSYHIESLNHTLIFQTGNDMTGDDAKYPHNVAEWDCEAEEFVSEHDFRDYDTALAVFNAVKEAYEAFDKIDADFGVDLCVRWDDEVVE